LHDNGKKEESHAVAGATDFRNGGAAVSDAASAFPRWSAAVTRVFEADESALRAVREREHPTVVHVMRWFTKLGDTPTWFAQLVILLLVLPEPARPAIGAMAAAGLFATVIVAVLKRVIRRPRPSRATPGLGGLLADPDAFSFPSGHSAVAFAVALSAFRELPALGAAELILASGIACSRVYLGAHYPLDVLVGIAIGIASASTVAAF
jgi:undecaprenyl-diphosphatase